MVPEVCACERGDIAGEAACYVCMFRKFQIALQSETWLWSPKGVERGSDERRKVSGLPQELSRIPSSTLPYCVILGTTDLFVPVYIRVDVLSPYLTPWEMSPLGKLRHTNKVAHKWRLPVLEATRCQ